VPGKLTNGTDVTLRCGRAGGRLLSSPAVGVSLDVSHDKTSYTCIGPISAAAVAAEFGGGYGGFADAANVVLLPILKLCLLLSTSLSKLICWSSPKR
jgi:hypothetical protein